MRCMYWCLSIIFVYFEK